MSRESDNEIVVDQVVYVFASASMAKAFETCLNTGTLSTCREDWQPIGVYPPMKIELPAE